MKDITHHNQRQQCRHTQILDTTWWQTQTLGIKDEITNGSCILFSISHEHSLKKDCRSKSSVSSFHILITIIILLVLTSFSL